ncbi:hypothetical protein CC1G_08004 [Coprinopsis cinerea okayama7|uniref:Zn(2)-C6 fungal-type domain-containing protein n=1 Tax=Coprinopsis cinerea (strain Okayama-7 / 130 / ATCC MYA-4618 / FGSC 9003) TaxID=240176 RepID=A8NQ79_COPC7|nr:hypothetical protein CC1G_08004 [Coprinopsis cinerea okayama7\|eukprot:XP_001835495.1 hypothetical protein CC1G_08004 [Coprinopsis cinerea okayama7\
MSSESFQPIQLKGEIMDLEFTVDTDHRKRRRNRTTQSCLNCHTSKRKCDRKRPCQRCIQLGLTGLCVYEIDDPALRDDPSLDENTRLRNRIAELESLVRELRGKPHPRWADSNFRDGDPNEKWHSRATKCIPLQKRSATLNDDHSGRNGRALPTLLSPIKTEPSAEAPNPNLYRFSPSPAPNSVRYHTFDVRRTSSNGSFNEDQQRPQTQQGQQPYNSPPSLGMTYPTSPNNSQYNGNSTSSSYSDNGSNGYPPLTNSPDGNNSTYNDQYSTTNGSTPQGYCPCRTNPSTGVAYINLSQQLQSSLTTLRQFSHHPPNTNCLTYRRVVELNDLLQPSSPRNSNTVEHSSNGAATNGTSSYDSSTPSDNELLTPLSASSGGGGGGHTTTNHFQATTGSPGMPPQEWSNMTTGGYNPYFSIPPAEHHGVYTHVIT